MSIKPEYSQAILRGEKTVEFRRVFSFGAAGSRIIIYESAPTMKIVGVAEIDFARSASADNLWDKSDMWLDRGPFRPGIDRETLKAYMGDKIGWAIHLRNVIKLEYPFSPKEIDPNFRPPQSYMWCPEWIQTSVKRQVYKQSLGPGGVEALLRRVITGLADDH